MARPTKLTSEVADRLVHAISVGASYKAACQYAGISYQTFLNWKKRTRRAATGDGGEIRQETVEADRRFVELFDHINKAEGDAAVVWLARIDKAAKRDWRAAAWKLERRFPREYGRFALASCDPDEFPAEATEAGEINSGIDNAAEIARVFAEAGVPLPGSNAGGYSARLDGEGNEGG